MLETSTRRTWCLSVSLFYWWLRLIRGFRCHQPDPVFVNSPSYCPLMVWSSMNNCCLDPPLCEYSSKGSYPSPILTSWPVLSFVYKANVLSPNSDTNFHNLSLNILSENSKICQKRRLSGVDVINFQWQLCYGCWVHFLRYRKKNRSNIWRPKQTKGVNWQVSAHFIICKMDVNYPNLECKMVLPLSKAVWHFLTKANKLTAQSRNLTPGVYLREWTCMSTQRLYVTAQSGNNSNSHQLVNE